MSTPNDDLKIVALQAAVPLTHVGDSPIGLADDIFNWLTEGPKPPGTPGTVTRFIGDEILGGEHDR